jgi:uncharacterized delta-60 repeat protein
MKSNKQHFSPGGVRIIRQCLIRLHAPRGVVTIQTLLAAFVLLWCAVCSSAQPGALDPAFYRYSVFDGVVYALTPQLDGNVLVGGAFNNVTGVPRNGIARVTTSGTLDTTFNPGIGIEGGSAGVYAMALYTNGANLGKVIIAGSFTQFNRVARASIARLNSDGTLDTSFNPGAGIQDGEVYSVALQTDGKVLVGGSFTQVQGVSRSGIARFNVNGTLDTTFNPGTGADGPVFGIAFQPNGKILIAGAFTAVRDASRFGVARLTSTGSLDALSSFDPGDGIDGGYAYALALQTDGRILVAGDFTLVQGIARDGVARLNADGSLDTQFAPDSGGNNTITVWAVAPAAGGKVLVGGEFEVMGGSECDGIARLDATGKQDPGFTNNIPDGIRFSVGHGEFIETMAVQADGSVLVGGTFEQVNNYYRAALARLSNDGSVDLVFNQESGTSFGVLSTAVQPDGKILLGGQFAYVNGAPHTGLGRLKADGLVDESFKADVNFSSKVTAVALYTNGPQAGKIVAGGTFTSVNGLVANGLALLNANGDVETSFIPVIQPGDVEALVLQADGKILIGGTFTNVNGVTRNGIARLNSDGSLDAGFDPGSGIGGIGIYAVALQTNQQILIGGAFTNFNGASRSGIARLSASGTLDPAFDPGSGVSDGVVRAVLIQPDGRILIGGGFTKVGGTARNGIARLNLDGTSDSNFNPGDGINDREIRALALQPNGKILIGGSFTNYNHISAGGVARLNADGGFDYGFDPGSGVSFIGQVRATVYSLSLQPDGKVILGGSFIAVNGVGGGANGNIERLLGGVAIPTPPSLLFWPLDQTAVAGEALTLEVLAAGSKPLSYQWRFKGANLSGATNAALQFASVSTNQAGAYSVIVRNSSGAITSAPITLTVIATVDLAQALNTPGWSWSNSGDRNWYGQTTISHDGVSAAQSGPIGNSQETSLSTVVNGPGRLTFWWKISSEEGYDWLDFYVNSVHQDETSGEIDWQQREFSIPAGPSTLTWVYSKDNVTAAGQDAAWVDQVVYTPSPALTPEMLPDKRFQLSVQSDPSQVVQIQASSTLTNWTTIAVLTNSNPPLKFIDEAATNFDRRFYRTLTP